MNRVIASDNQRLDEIVYKEYGTLEFFVDVLEKNQHLTNKVILKMGDVVNIPVITKNKEIKEDSLW